jgi:hypothetical protein
MKLLSVLFFFLILGLQTKAQGNTETASIFSTWCTAVIKYSINKKNALNYTQQLRFDDGVNQFQSLISDLNFDHEIKKNWEVSIGYRISERLNQHSAHRFYADAAYSIKNKKFQVTNRVRFQKEFSFKQSVDNYWRNKLSIKYRKFKKITPEISGEVFYNINNKTISDSRGGILFDRYRLSIGADYKVSKKLGIDFNYILQNDINVRVPSRGNIYSISLSYKIK